MKRLYTIMFKPVVLNPREPITVKAECMFVKDGYYHFSNWDDGDAVYVTAHVVNALDVIHVTSEDENND